MNSNQLQQLPKIKLLPSLTDKQLRNFWGQVRLGTQIDCWPWEGYCLDSDYGQFKVNYRNYRVHRLAYWVHYKQQPNEKLVCHHCDNKKCCNPLHLFLGSNADNSADMVKKNRVSHIYGMNHGQHKLTDAQVYVIRDSTQTCEELGYLYNISPAMISNIRCRKNWTHI
jgi:hypothetical protein